MRISVTAIIALFILCGISAFAQVLDKNILIDPSTYSVDVYLQPSSVKGWNDKTKWIVVAIDGAGNVQKVELKNISAPDSSMFSLLPVDTSASSPIAKASQVIVRFDKSITIVPGPQAPKPSNKPLLGPASNKQSADLYLSGTYSPAINSPPQYQIDGFVAVMKDLSKTDPAKGQLGLVGAVTTDKRRQVDPDSYRVFVAYQNTLSAQWHGPLQGVLLTWLVGGAEFDRKTNNVNFITAPYLDFPIRLFPQMIRATTQPMAVLTATVGFEAGHNFHNVVTPNQARGVFRGVASGSFLFRFNPKLPGFKGAELSSAYTLRQPALEEIFTSTKIVNGQSVDVPVLSTKPRHYIKQQLDFKLTDAFSLTLKHEYGAIPPAFRMVDHKASVGLTFSLRQLRDGVPTAIRSK